MGDGKRLLFSPSCGTVSSRSNTTDHLVPRPFWSSGLTSRVEEGTAEDDRTLPTLFGMSALQPTCGNFFESIPGTGKDEVFEELVRDGNVLVERIISEGHVSSEWYDQEESEFCCILRGAADLLFEGNEHPIRMNPGAWLFIPAHAKHKVTWTAPNEPTVWIAVKWKGSSGRDPRTSGRS